VMPNANLGEGQQQAQQQPAQKEDDLSSRLAQLRGS
jgi:hypothetical protein